MSRLRKIAEIPAGSWTKWVVVGIWVVVICWLSRCRASSPARRRTTASAWLPGSAESTKVLDVQAHFQSPNVYPGVVVYERPSGLTAADRAKAAADARMFAGLPGVVPGRCMGPIPSADGQALQTILQVDLGTQGWAGASKVVDASARSPPANANGLISHITGQLGNAADNNNVFKGIDGTLLLAALAVVIVILLITYRSPVLVAAAGDLLRGGADHRRSGDLPSRRPRRPGGQRAERRHLGGAGLRRQHGLRAADRRALPGGTAPPRPPSRRPWPRRCGARARPSSPAVPPSSWRC